MLSSKNGSKNILSLGHAAGSYQGVREETGRARAETGSRISLDKCRGAFTYHPVHLQDHLDTITCYM